MTTIDLADVIERRLAKSYATLGEAFEDLLADLLVEARDSGPLPDDLAEVDVFWQSEQG